MATNRKATSRSKDNLKRGAARLRSGAPEAGPETAVDTVAPGRADRRAERRAAILTAALDEFSTRGFAAARLDDVAHRAGVAKGTIYLHFDDKEALFQELVRSFLIPQVAMMEQAPVGELSSRELIERFLERFLTEIYTTRRREVLRLILTEGHRFPALAEFYYREVVARGIAAIRMVLARAVARGELSGDALVRFPQLLVAPLLMSIVWSGLFDRFAPLDIPALLRAHLDLVFGERKTT